MWSSWTRFRSRLFLIFVLACIAATAGHCPGCPGFGHSPATPLSASGDFYVTVSPAEVVRGQTASGAIVRTGSGYRPQQVFFLTAAPASAVQMPASVTAGENSTIQAFEIVTRTDHDAASVAITARDTAGESSIVVLTIHDPDLRTGLKVRSFTLDHDDVIGGDDVFGTVTLDRPRVEVDRDPLLRVVPSDPGFFQPVQVPIPLGASSARFKLQTSRVTRIEHVVATLISLGSSGLTAAFSLLPGPRLDSVTPAQGTPGQVEVELKGEFLALGGGTAVTVGGAGATASDVRVMDDRTVLATLTIATDAAAGARPVRVTTSHGASEPVNFVVRTAAPELISVTPTVLPIGSTTAMTLTGVNFVAPASVAVSGAGVTVSNVTVVNGTNLTAQFVVDAGAAAGSRSVSVTTPAGTSNSVPITFVDLTPTLASIAPTSGDVGFNVSVTLTGTNFTAGATVSISGAEVTVSNVTVVNSTTITATFGIGQFAPPGPRTVTVTTSAGTSNGVTFTINP